MKKTALFLLMMICSITVAHGQTPPGPYPSGITLSSQGDGVWRFDRQPTNQEPAFFQKLRSMFTMIKPPNPIPFGRSVAFLIGVGTYRHMMPLTHTGTDVTSVRNFLLQSGSFDTVFEVRDEKVSSELLNRYMFNRFSTDNPRYLTGKDRFLLYYSGHGGNQGELGYLLFSNADPQHDDYVTDALDMGVVRRWAYVSVARQVLIVLDTCNSGLAVQAESDPPSGLGGDPSGILITATTGNQEAYQVSNNQKGYGVFTHAFLEALQVGIDSKTPFIDIFEVYSRTRSAVRDFEIEKSVKMQPDIQHRLKRRNFERANGNFVFLNLNPTGKDSKAPGKKYLGLAVERKGTEENELTAERLRAAHDQFELLKDSTQVSLMQTYVDEYKDMLGARIWVAILSSRIEALIPSTSHVSQAVPSAQRELEQVLMSRSVYFPTAYPTSTNPNGGLLRSQQEILIVVASSFREYLKIKPEARLHLRGHSDSRGQVYDLDLAQRRATRVQSFLIDQGVPSDHIDTETGERDRPISAEEAKLDINNDRDLTAAEKDRLISNLKTIMLAMNRRVDLTISTNGQSSPQAFPFYAPDALTLLGGREKAKSTGDKNMPIVQSPH